MFTRFTAISGGVQASRETFFYGCIVSVHPLNKLANSKRPHTNRVQDHWERVDHHLFCLHIFDQNKHKRTHTLKYTVGTAAQMCWFVFLVYMYAHVRISFMEIKLKSSIYCYRKPTASLCTCECAARSPSRSQTSIPKTSTPINSLCVRVCVCTCPAFLTACFRR